MYLECGPSIVLSIGSRTHASFSNCTPAYVLNAILICHGCTDHFSEYSSPDITTGVTILDMKGNLCWVTSELYETLSSGMTISEYLFRFSGDA